MDDRKQPPPLNNILITAFGNTIIADNSCDDEINLNEVLHASLKKQTEKGAMHPILRSDKLPTISGSREKITQMFDAISFMIINHPPPNSKLFLYVKCERKDSDPETMNLSSSGLMYNLSFHANIDTDENWKLVYKEQLAVCAFTAEEIKGNFVFHPISNTGCLFSLTLSGKNC